MLVCDLGQGYNKNSGNVSLPNGMFIKVDEF